MALFEFGDQTRLGIPPIDGANECIVAFANRLHDAIRCGRAPEECACILPELVTFAADAFASEEALLVEIGYADLDAHHRAHETLRAEISVLDSRIRSGEHAALAFRLSKLLREWITRHIMVADRAYASLVKERGDRCSNASSTTPALQLNGASDR